MKHAKHTTDNVFFVGVREPVEVRKEILGCAKDVIGNLRAFERFKDVRKSKVDQSAKLKKNIDEIILLTNRLKNKLPKSQLRALAKIQEPELGIAIAEERPRRKSSSALDKLDQELAVLEGKLGQLK